MRPLLLSLYSLLGTQSGLGSLSDIRTNARGIAWFEGIGHGNSPVAANITHGISHLQLSSMHQQVRPQELATSTYKLPVTIFVSQKASQGSGIQDYLGLLLPQILIQCIPIDLTDEVCDGLVFVHNRNLIKISKAFPATDVARLRSVGEIQKFIVNTIPAISCGGRERIGKCSLKWAKCLLYSDPKQLVSPNGSLQKIAHSTALRLLLRVPLTGYYSTSP